MIVRLQTNSEDSLNCMYVITRPWPGTYHRVRSSCYEQCQKSTYYKLALWQVKHSKFLLNSTNTLHISLYYSDICNLPLNPSKPYLPSLNLRRVFEKNKTFTAVTFRGLSQHTRDTSKSQAVENSTTVVNCLDVAIKKVEVSIFFIPVNPAERPDKLRSFC